MSVEAFRDYYENHHAKLCEKYTTGVSRYMRRFLDPLPDPATGASEDLPFDVITELWFEDEAVFRATVDYLSTSVMPEEVIEDEKKLFDRPMSRIATAVEYESRLPGQGAR
ncbi:MAG: EthD domain-containing protein [Rhizomicrobium sp.]